MIYAKIGGLVFILAAFCGAAYHFGGSNAREQLETYIANNAVTEVKHDTAQAKTDQTAEAAHDQDIEAIATRPVGPPLRLYTLASCPSAVPVPAQAPSEHPTGRRTDGGNGIDVRPILTAIEHKYEIALADCRELYARWPR